MNNLTSRLSNGIQGTIEQCPQQGLRLVVTHSSFRGNFIFTLTDEGLDVKASDERDVMIGKPPFNSAALYPILSALISKTKSPVVELEGKVFPVTVYEIKRNGEINFSFTDEKGSTNYFGMQFKTPLTAKPSVVASKENTTPPNSIGQLIKEPFNRIQVTLFLHLVKERYAQNYLKGSATPSSTNSSTLQPITTFASRRKQ